jgi:formylglycine-generating enzyme required for sulfatase activity
MRSLGAILLAVMLCGSSQAHAEKRAALVMGNGSYRNVPSLLNPRNDATEIGELFRSAGFSVVDIRRDLGISEMRRAISDFAEAASDVDVAIVYFAGHGIEVDGSNYVIPIDAKLLRDFDIEDETVSVERILKSIEPAKRLRLIILDACRDNPFLKTMKRTVASRSVGRGLAKVEPVLSDTLIAFAAKAGSIALDGDAKNSPFTLALLHNIAAPGVDLRIAFGRVRDEVLKATNHKQEPFVYGSLGGSVISIVDAPKIAPSLSTDEIVWNAIKDSAYPVVFEEFLGKFPTSQHVTEAQSLRDELKKKQAAAEARIPPPPRADEIVWTAIKDSNYPAIFEDFLNKFPTSPHLVDARLRRDDLKKQLAASQLPPPAPADDIVWNAIKSSQDPAIFEEFVGKYPASPRVGDAQLRRDGLKKQLATAAARVTTPPAADEIVWKAIKDSRYSAIFEDFLSKFPDSPHQGDARSRFDELSKKEELDQKKIVALVPPPLPAPERNPSSTNGIDIGLKVLEQSAARALKPKATFRECAKCPEMVVVPDGIFLMGSPEKEPRRESVEGPQHKVTILHPFAAGRFAVTFEEWDICVADGGCNGYRPWDNGWGRGKRPVISVSWQDAKSYVAWLSQRTGKPYRLLSEAEREYVARAGTASPYWWGASASRHNANYNDKAAKDNPSSGSTAQKTMPVDSFQPNPWGFYQVSGNIWEWVEDCMNDGYAGAPADGSARTTGNCEKRALRGGSWISDPSLLRSAGRYGVQADGRVGNVGFRVARTLKE